LNTGNRKATTPEAGDRAAIAALYHGMLDGWNAGDSHRFVAPFADDLDFIGFDGTHLTDRTEVATFHQTLFGRWLKGSRLTGEPQIRLISPDAALIVALGDTLLAGKAGTVHRAQIDSDPHRGPSRR
jgi:uncharacterized protein (TIGR02246 family)